jgi:hypothetical protein
MRRHLVLAFASLLLLNGCEPKRPQKAWQPPPLVMPPIEAMYQEMDEGNLDVAKGILNDLWPARGYPDAKLPSVLTWTEDPYDDAYFRFMFYSLRHLEHLLYAYRKTNDRQYLDKLLSVLNSFVAYDANRPYDGKKLDDSHTSGYRAMVLTNMFYKLKQLGELSPSLEQGLRDSVQRVANLLLQEEHFEYWANHGFTEAGALLLVGKNFPDLPEAPVWHETGVQRLDLMRRTNVDADGVDIENSPFYHQYVLGMIAQIALWAKQFEPSVGDTYEPTAASMLKYLAYVARPDGEVPMLGASQETTIQSRDPKLYGSLSAYDQEYAWAYSEGRVGTPLQKRVRLFPVSGLFVLRSLVANTDQTYVSFNAGAYRTEHSHLDAQSVTIYSDGVNLCPDSGLFSYLFTASYDYFHGTRAHNTVVVDGADQLEGAAFPGAYGVVGNTSWATAWSTAYYGVDHLRTVVILDQSQLLIVDTLSSKSPHDYTQTWHLAPGAGLSMQGLDANVTDSANAPVLLLRQAELQGLTVANTFGADDGGEHMQGWSSSLYNEKEPVHALEYTRHGTSATFATLFLMGPYAASSQPVELSDQRDGATGEHVVLVCAEGVNAAVHVMAEGTSEATVEVVAGGGCQPSSPKAGN